MHSCIQFIMEIAAELAEKFLPQIIEEIENLGGSALSAAKDTGKQILTQKATEFGVKGAQKLLGGGSGNKQQAIEAPTRPGSRPPKTREDFHKFRKANENRRAQGAKRPRLEEPEEEQEQAPMEEDQASVSIDNDDGDIEQGGGGGGGGGEVKSRQVGEGVTINPYGSTENKFRFKLGGRRPIRFTNRLHSSEWSVYEGGAGLTISDYDTGYHVMPDKPLGFYCLENDIMKHAGAAGAIRLVECGWKVSGLKFYQYEVNAQDQWVPRPALQSSIQMLHDKDEIFTDTFVIRNYDHSTKDFLEPTNYNTNQTIVRPEVQQQNTTHIQVPPLLVARRGLFKSLGEVEWINEEIEKTQLMALTSEGAAPGYVCTGYSHEHLPIPNIEAYEKTIPNESCEGKLHAKYKVNGPWMNMRNPSMQRLGTADVGPSSLEKAVRKHGYPIRLTNKSIDSFRSRWYESMTVPDGHHQTTPKDLDMKPFPHVLFKAETLLNDKTGNNTEIWVHGVLDTYAIFETAYSRTQQSNFVPFYKSVWGTPDTTERSFGRHTPWSHQEPNLTHTKSRRNMYEHVIDDDGGDERSHSYNRPSQQFYALPLRWGLNTMSETQPTRQARSNDLQMLIPAGVSKHEEVRAIAREEVSQMITRSQAKRAATEKEKVVTEKKKK